jgi:hypothetical protein
MLSSDNLRASRVRACVCLSILVGKLRRHGSFRSINDLRTLMLALIDHFDRTMANPSSGLIKDSHFMSESAISGQFNAGLY